MRPDLLEILCCPLCQGDLTLRTDRTEKEEIISGNLTCQKCRTEFPIEDGIPDMLPPEERD